MWAPGRGIRTAQPVRGADIKRWFRERHQDVEIKAFIGDAKEKRGGEGARGPLLLMLGESSPERIDTQHLCNAASDKQRGSASASYV